MIPSFVKQLFSTTYRPEEKPDDLRAFEEARDRLTQATRTVAIEADAFGKMLRDMKHTARKRRKQ